MRALPALRSPTSGLPLRAQGPHALVDGAGGRWPVVEGIAYLRAGSQPLAAAALEWLDAGDAEGALALLLAENDRWWDEPPPPEPELRRLVREADGLSLREAMARLGWGRVADYFAHRWSDPTFLAGLALADAHWSAPRTAFELCCGVGHHLRALQGAGVAATGGDVVFAKLWVARRWVVGDAAALVCFDAEAPWPLAGPYDLVACHDAFYFLADKAAAAGRLRGLTAPGGTLLVSHVHNRGWSNFSAGAAVDADALAALFPGALAYADEALTEAAVRGEAPAPQPLAALGATEAFSVVEGGAWPPRVATGPLSRPPAGAPLRRNPLVAQDGSVRWPSDRYRDEYGPRATYGRLPAPARAAMGAATAELAARRELVDLPERWG